MKKRILKNRLLILIQERERKIGRRIKMKDLADFAGVTYPTLRSWTQNDVRKYEAQIIEGFCEYFDCDVADLLYFEWEEVEKAPE